MTVLPSSLALTSIADGSNIVAADHRNNYTAVQTALNALIALLAAGSTGQSLVSSGGTTIGWQTATATTYRKTTSKAVNTTTSATDLLNGEITVAAGAMGTTGLTRLTAWGDVLQNVGSSQTFPRFQLLLGGTTLIDTNAPVTCLGNGATRHTWRIVAEILNLGSASSQLASFDMLWGPPFGVGVTINTAVNFTTGSGVYSTTNANHAFARGENTGLTVNTASSAALLLNVINGASSASYETRLLGALVEII